MQQESSSLPPKPKSKKGLITSPDKKKMGKKRRRGGLLNLLLFIGIIGAVAMFIWAEQERRDALSKLQKTEEQLKEIKESTERSGQFIADEVLGKLRKHIDISDEQQPTVATIVDVDRLREASDFYKNAENGDNLILTKTRAILYDPDRDIIIDVVPVVLNQDQNQPGDNPSEGNQPDNNAPADNQNTSNTSNNQPPTDNNDSPSNTQQQAAPQN